MGSKRRKKGAHRSNGTKGNGSPPAPKENHMLQIPNPLPIKHEETSTEKGQYTEQKTNRAAQLGQAKLLNWITAVGVGIAILTLIGLICSVQQSRHALEFNERAWILPTMPVVEQTETGETYFKIPFKNTGHTPALRTHAWIGTVGDFNKITTADPIGDADKTGNFVVPPDGTGNTSTIDDPIDKGFVDQIKNGATLYIYGTIAYVDIFGNSHWTQFCVYPGRDLKAFAPCSKHNTTDDEQKK
jgi:hypothetical protein